MRARSSCAHRSNTMDRLHEQVKVVSVLTPQSVGAGTTDSSALDWAGFDRVLYVLHSGVTTAGGTLDVKITDATTSGGTYADVASAAFVQITPSNDVGIYVLDCPVVTGRQFHKVNQVGATQASIYGITAIGYRGTRTLPAAQSNTVVVA